MSLVREFKDVVQILVQFGFVAAPVDDDIIVEELPDVGVVQANLQRILAGQPEGQSTPQLNPNWQTRFAAFGEALSKLKAQRILGSSSPTPPKIFIIVKETLLFCNIMRRFLSEDNGSATQKKDWLEEIAECLKKFRPFARLLLENDAISYQRLEQLIRYYQQSFGTHSNDEEIEAVLGFHELGIKKATDILCKQLLISASSILASETDKESQTLRNGIRHLKNQIDNRGSNLVEIIANDDVVIGRTKLSSDFQPLGEGDWIFIFKENFQAKKEVPFSFMLRRTPREDDTVPVYRFNPATLIKNKREIPYNLNQNLIGCIHQQEINDLGKLFDVMITEEGELKLFVGLDNRKFGINYFFPDSDFSFFVSWDEDLKGLTIEMTEVSKDEDDNYSYDPITDIELFKSKVNAMVERLNSKGGLEFLGHMSRLRFVPFGKYQTETLEYQLNADGNRLIPLSPLNFLDSNLKSFRNRLVGIEATLDNPSTYDVLRVAQKLGSDTRRLNSQLTAPRPFVEKYLQLANSLVSQAEVENPSDANLRERIRKVRVGLKTDAFWTDTHSVTMIDALTPVKPEGVDHHGSIIQSIEDIYNLYEKELEVRLPHILPKDAERFHKADHVMASMERLRVSRTTNLNTIKSRIAARARMTRMVR